MTRAFVLLSAVHCLCLGVRGFVVQPSGIALQRATRSSRSCHVLRAEKDDAPPDKQEPEEPRKPSNNDGSMSLHEGSLPLSFRSDAGTRDAEFYLEDGEKGNLNPYFDVVRRLSPTEMIGRFMRSGSPRVQEAVRTTVLGLLGSLPKQAFETATLTTGDALANLMFQLQMTGYMFKNAEYRLSLQNSLRESSSVTMNDNQLPSLSNIGAIDAVTTPANTSSGNEIDAKVNALLPLDDDGNIVIKKPTISGKVKLTYENGQEVEVDAQAYMSELASQVHALQSQLATVQSKQQEAETKDLLVYIRNMPESQMRSLSEGISKEVLESMKLLVETVMRSMGGTQIQGKTITQQSGAGMAQLCLWQLACGYNLAEMEARERIKKQYEAE